MRYPLQTALGTVALAALLAAPALAQATRVMVNDREVDFPDQQAVERDGRVYIPLRGVLERIGADTIQWRPARGEVFVASGAREIRLRIGDTRALVDGREVELDAPPILVGERTMVPLRFVGENLGATVRWEGYTRTVYISVPRERVAGRREETPPDRVDDRETPRRNPLPPREPPRDLGLVIRPRHPLPGEAISTRRPEISAILRAPGGGEVDYDSIRMWVNGEEVTKELEIGVNSVTYRPDEPLDLGVNRVELRVRDHDGHMVTHDWTFRVR